MSVRSRRCLQRRSRPAQRGVALLVLLLLLILGGSTVFLAARNAGTNARPVATERREAAALGVALAALRMYNIDDDKLPGTMPCPDDHTPDHTRAGTASLLAGDDCPAYMARLPWRTLDANRAAGRLWYVLDPAFRDDGAFRDTDAGEAPVNPNLAGSLALDGRTGYAALVIDPGPPLQGQTERRQSGESLEDFLDGTENTDGDMAFVNCAGIDACNDRIVGLRPDVLLAAVQRRALALVAEELRAFEADAGYWPFAAGPAADGVCEDGREEGVLALEAGSCGAGSTLTPCDFSPQLDCAPEALEVADRHWLTWNDWPGVIYYRVDADCTPAAAGCADPNLEIINEGAAFAVVLGGAGPRHSDQDRPGSAVADYLDDAANRTSDCPGDSPSDGCYRDHPLGPSDNDAFRGVTHE